VRTRAAVLTARAPRITASKTRTAPSRASQDARLTMIALRMQARSASRSWEGRDLFARRRGVKSEIRASPIPIAPRRGRPALEAGAVFRAPLPPTRHAGWTPQVARTPAYRTRRRSTTCASPDVQRMRTARPTGQIPRRSALQGRDR
jgi:hypothetical protein